MGIAPNHWGPYVWASIHLICLGAPDTLDAAQQQAYKSFFTQLPYVIPCTTCASHLKENLQKVPIDNALTGREDLFAWSVRLHNLVNQQLGKPTMDLAKARETWMTPKVENEGHARVHHASSPKNVLYLLSGIAIGAMLMFAFARLNKGRNRM